MITVIRMAVTPRAVILMTVILSEAKDLGMRKRRDPSLALRMTRNFR